jgi:RNA polymerase sigma-70 factor, ECF subfamily
MPEKASDQTSAAADLDPRELVQSHQAGTWRYLRTLGASPQLAEELLQDTFVVAWQRGIRDDGEIAVATYLRRTARHLYLKHCRAQGRRDELLADAVDHLWQRTCEADNGEHWLLALRDCTQQLEGRARTAVHLCYGPEAVRGGREQAAKSLGIKPNGLKTLLQRVRSVLRECIENKLEGK